MECQVRQLPEAGHELSVFDRILIRSTKSACRFFQKVTKALTHPSLALNKLSNIVTSHRTGSSDSSAPMSQAQPHTTAPRASLLSIGDMVRVKSPQEIRGTLGSDNRCEGLGYMPTVMDKYCGGTYRVKKLVHLFFDERRQRLCKLRHVVILEAVYCEPPLTGEASWSGCDRTCYLFWKDTWLEKIPDGAAFMQPVADVIQGQS